MRTHFFTGNWSNASLQEAIKKIKSEKALCFYWKKLLREIHIPESQIKLSTDVLSAFVRKFSKRRCVTYLAKDGLSPLHEEDESAIRQMLKKFKKTDEQIRKLKQMQVQQIFVFVAISKVTGLLIV